MKAWGVNPLRGVCETRELWIEGEEEVEVAHAVLGMMEGVEELRMEEGVVALQSWGFPTLAGKFFSSLLKEG